MLFLPIYRKVAERFFSEGILPTCGSERAALYVVTLALGADAVAAKLHWELPSLSRELALLSELEIKQKLKELTPSALESFDALELYWLDSGIYWTPENVRIPEVYDFGFQQQFENSLSDASFNFYAQSVDDDYVDADFDDFGSEKANHSRRVRGTSDQLLAIQTISTAASDEHFYITAYAGTGKSHLVETIADLSAWHCTYLAPVYTHAYGFKARFPERIRSRLKFVTFNEVLDAALKKFATHKQYELLTNTTVSKMRTAEERAQQAGIPRIGARTPKAVLAELDSVIMKFCRSADTRICDTHLKGPVDPPAAERAIYLAWADEIWRGIFEQPRRDRIVQLKPEYLAKWLALKGAGIPGYFGTLLVDEAHDLSVSWVNLLRSYPLRCVMMGDPHQRWHGTDVKPEVSRGKLLAMSQSLRSGLQADRWISRTLEFSPVTQPNSDRPFRGDLGHRTRLIHPRNIGEQPGDALWLCGDYWELLEAVQRFATQGAVFFVLPASASGLKFIVKNAYSLLSTTGADTFGGVPVDECTTRDTLSASLVQRGYGKILRMFERGFTPKNLDESLEKQTTDNAARLILGHMSHAKNIESDKVILSPSYFREFERTTQQGGRHYYTKNRMASHLLYMGMSRSRHELWLPGDTLDQMKDLSMREITIGAAKIESSKKLNV